MDAPAVDEALQSGVRPASGHGRRRRRRPWPAACAAVAIAATAACLPRRSAFSLPTRRVPLSSLAARTAADHRPRAAPTQAAVLRSPHAAHRAAPSAAHATWLAAAAVGAAAAAALGRWGASLPAAPRGRGARSSMGRRAAPDGGAAVQAPPETQAEAPAAPSAADAGAAAAAVATGAGGAATLQGREVTLELAARRMLTKADSWHVHAISGTVHTVIGLLYLLDVVAGDVAKLGGAKWDEHISFEVVLVSMMFGAINAASGLQPTLLPRPFKDWMQLLGFGEEGNLKSAGFVNTAAFYFFLTYQSLRVLPEYPVWLQPLDPIFAAITLVAIWHAIFIINSWVGRGKLDQAFAIGMSAPLLLNVPVSAHLLLEGQTWVENLTRAYPGWPEVFFSANYALAWAGSVVALVLSLYERRVVSITDRTLLTVLLGAVTFTVIPLQGYLLVPQWFQGEWMVMLTLTPP